MYRIVGCILVVAAGAGLGVSESIRVSERIYTLEMLLRMVICLKGEIRCGNASLPDAFYGAAGRMNGKYREFLITVGEYLGYMDLEMQIKQLSLYEKNLEEEISRLKEEASGKKRLYRSLGILGGLLLAVLLV